MLTLENDEERSVKRMSSNSSSSDRSPFNRLSFYLKKSTKSAYLTLLLSADGNLIVRAKQYDEKQSTSNTPTFDEKVYDEFSKAKAVIDSNAKMNNQLQKYSFQAEDSQEDEEQEAANEAFSDLVEREAFRKI